MSSCVCTTGCFHVCSNPRLDKPTHKKQLTDTAVHTAGAVSPQVDNLPVMEGMCEPAKWEPQMPEKSPDEGFPPPMPVPARVQPHALGAAYLPTLHRPIYTVGSASTAVSTFAAFAARAASGRFSERFCPPQAAGDADGASLTRGMSTPVGREPAGAGPGGCTTFRSDSNSKHADPPGSEGGGEEPIAERAARGGPEVRD